MKSRKKLINPPKKKKSLESITSKKTFKTKSKGIINKILLYNHNIITVIHIDIRI